MHKIYTLLLLLACTAIGYSQNISVKGRVTTASDNLPLESATVYITTVKDSAVVDYTISDKNGNWEIKTRAITQPVNLKISFIGFENYSKQLESVTQNTDLGTTALNDQAKQLGEVVITAETPPIRIKSDTLEFNASSFKVRPDANVQTLLKQLPGVEIDNQGKITINGKEVNQVLVNGKPFFGRDGKIALQNLPADIINKVQVSDTKTKVEELSGQKASGNTSSINLTIDEDKNKGLFGKFMGGYGTNERYESSGLLNYFKDKRKVSILASSNNINATGFSMDEVFDNMGGGRALYSSANSNLGVSRLLFGGGDDTGITRSNLIGINYADEWLKNLDNNASYFYSSSNTINNNRMRQQNFLPQTEDPNNAGTFINNNFTRESESSSVNDSYAHTLNTEFEYKIDSTSTLRIAPAFTKANSVSKNTSRQVATDENNELLNESNGFTSDENDNTSFNNDLYYNKVLGRKGRNIGVFFNNENNIDDAANLNQSTTILYEDTNGDGITEPITDIRNQIRYNRRTQDNYEAGFTYLEPVLDSLSIQGGFKYDFNRSVEDREGFDFDNAANSFSQLNSALTNYLSSTTKTATPAVTARLNKSKINAQLTMGTSLTHFDNYSIYLDNTTKLNKEYIYPHVTGNVRYTIAKSKSVYAFYRYNVFFPQAQQILPVEDVSNPLATFIGNPDLDPNKAHSINLGFNNYNYASRSGYNIYAYGSINDSQIISSTLYQESAKSRTSYENVGGTYNLGVGANVNKSIKREANNYRVGLNLSLNNRLDKGFTNGEIYEARSIGLTPRLNFNYEYGELLMINPSYSFDYSETNYTNYTVNSRSNFVHRATLETTSYWPKHIVFGNDFNYTYTSQIADGFRKDFFLWNTSLGYNFLDDKFLFKIKVYDVLNQNLATTRTITATSVTDQQNTVLRRYAMFSLTYKLEKFGAKNKDERKSRRRIMRY